MSSIVLSRTHIYRKRRCCFAPTFVGCGCEAWDYPWTQLFGLCWAYII